MHWTSIRQDWLPKDTPKFEINYEETFFPIPKRNAIMIKHSLAIHLVGKCINLMLKMHSWTKI